MDKEDLKHLHEHLVAFQEGLMWRKDIMWEAIKPILEKIEWLVKNSPKDGADILDLPVWEGEAMGTPIPPAGAPPKPPEHFPPGYGPLKIPKEQFKVQDVNMEMAMQLVAVSLSQMIPKTLGYTLLLYDLMGSGKMFYLSTDEHARTLTIMKEFIKMQEAQPPK